VLPGYSATVATHADSSASSPALHQFMVMAHAGEASWPSNAMTGYSVDNLAPMGPSGLEAMRVGNYVQLHWHPGGEEEPDFSRYLVYRANTTGVTPDPAYFISAAHDTTLWDRDAPAGVFYYYIVTAIDVHEAESAPSNEAAVSYSTTGIGDTPSLLSLEVRPNVPNPFSHTTGLEVGLPAAADIAIEVFDVLGRRVASRTVRGHAGWQRVRFDGRDDTGRLLPSGVYFTRVRAGTEVVTRKMVLRR
jgi:hypothetical protein